MKTTRTENLQRYREKLLSRFPAAAKAEIRAANEKSADQMVSTVKRIIPKGDDQAPELEDTVVKRAGDLEFGGLGFIVSIGGPGAPYPLHLEGGHKAPDGSHVPPKPFWNPARHKVAKTHKGRIARAQRKAVQSIVGGS